jgi:toxin secretion/phage lysis holin
MKELWTYLQVVVAAAGGWFGWALGGFDGFLYALIAFVVIDYITGLMSEIIEKRLSSEIGAKGIFKKVLIFFLVGVAHIIDSQIIGDGSAIRTAVIFFEATGCQASCFQRSTGTVPPASFLNYKKNRVAIYTVHLAGYNCSRNLE